MIDVNDFQEFKKQTGITLDSICRDFVQSNRGSIQVKKEDVAVKNLVKIFRSTLKLSGRKGFQNMTLRDLCRDSGLSMGALYSYFSSKSELLGVMHDQGHRTIMKIMEENVGQDGDVRESLRVAIRTHLFLSEVMNEWFYFFFMETKNLDKEYRRKPVEIELATEHIFVEILNQGRAEEKFFFADAGLVASMIKALMQDWYLKRWKYSRRKVSVEEYADFVVEVVETYCVGNRALVSP